MLGLFRGLVVCCSHLFHFTPETLEALFRLGAEKSNSPDAQGVIKVLLRAFLASSKTVKIHVKSVRRALGGGKYILSVLFLLDWRH